MLVDGQTRSLSCTDIQLRVETQGGKYESIITNTTIYRSINATDLTMRCQCANESKVPSWSLPAGYTLTDTFSSTKCLHIGICIMNNKTLSFLQLKRKHSGYYKCHVNSSSIGFMLHVIGGYIYDRYYNIFVASLFT